MAEGKVILVGAGPGDAGLLTLKGRQALESAQVVVYDRLVGREVLDMIPSGARRIDVGKTAGRHPVPQEEINRLLLELALAGQRVVRLKGGDSFVFGRGGEELELLAAHGVSFEVVPGVPSAIAATAYAGIPVTHRDYCSSVHFITGHRRENGQLSLPYAALSQLTGTLVFFMALSTVDEIAQGLMAAGMDPDCPCALIENGTRPEQRKFVTCLARAGETLAAGRVISPALFVVGRVCALSDQLDWFSRLPLKGARILVTRPQSLAHRLSDGLRELGAWVDEAPAIATRPLDFELPPLSDFRALAFTSAAGVSAFFGRLLACGLDARALNGLLAVAVGPGTAQRLLEFGVRADFTPSVYSGEALGRELLEGDVLRPGDRVLLARARKASPELPQELARSGVRVEELAVYETVLTEKALGDLTVYDYVTFTSASCVEGLARSAQGADLSRVHALCIGESTARAARAHGMDVRVSPEATIQAMIQWIGGMHRESHR